MYVYIYNIIYLSSQFLCMVYLIEMYGGMCTFEQLLQLYIYFLKDKARKKKARPRGVQSGSPGCTV